jgi:hypothetical protein
LKIIRNYTDISSELVDTDEFHDMLVKSGRVEVGVAGIGFIFICLFS